MSREPTEILVVLHAETQRSVLVSNDGINAHAKWIGKTVIGSLHRTGKTTRGTDRDEQEAILPMANLTIPEWLAIKEGFV